MMNEKMTTSAIELITPEIAQEMLEHNTKNRNPSRRRIDYYRQEMGKGNWKLGTDMIAFDTEGNLINGQHRLIALKEYGKPLHFVVGRNMSVDAFAVIDTGKMRTAGDVLSINGITCGNQKAGIIRSYMNLNDGNHTRHKGANASNKSVLEFAERNAFLVTEASSVAYKTYYKFRGLKPHTVGGLYWMFQDINKYDAVDFFKLLAEGANMESTHPVFVLREKLRKNIESGGQKKYPEMTFVAWTIIAWNLFRDNKQIKNKKIEYNVANPFPRPR